MKRNPFRDQKLRDFLCRDCDPAAMGLTEVATTGSGPFEEAEFDEFLKSHGIEPHTIESNLLILVIGEKGWHESDLRKLLQARSGKRLQVYSQDMFAMYLATGTDPLSYTRSAIDDFAGAHPALRFLTVDGFDWPTTRVESGGETELVVDWLKIGYLKFLGYAVGRSGDMEKKRRAVLQTAYRTPSLPSKFPRDYRKKWGQGRTSTRLKAMAYSIASFCRNAKRRPHAMEIAVSEWEADLEWLRISYYKGRKHSFTWPNTKVP